MLDCSRNVRIARTSTAGDHNIFCVQDAFRFVLENGNNIVSIFKVSKPVDVLDFLVAEVDASYPIHRLDVILDGFSEFGPVVVNGFGAADFPAVSF